MLVVEVLTKIIATVCLCVLISSCDSMLESDVVEEQILTEEDFRRAQGHKLHYDIYLPSTWTGWVHEEHCLFHFNPETKTYLMESIVIGQKEVDNLGSRFKISSQDWRYQFGFGHHGVSLNESTLGLSLSGLVVRIGFSTSGRSDMRIEFAENELRDMQGKVLSFELKVLDDSSKPSAMLLIKLKDPSDVITLQ